MRSSFILILVLIFGIVAAGCTQQEQKPTTPTKTSTPFPTPVPTLDIESIKKRAVEDAVTQLMIFALNFHFDNPDTPEIEGINVNPEYGCFGCHFSKEAIPRMKEWGSSSHAGFILELKEKDVTASVKTENAPAYVFFDFKKSEYQICQRCHTSTGFRNFAESPQNYNPANNTFMLVGEQRELLYCWACHDPETKQLRNPGKFSLTSPYSEPADRISAVPDLGNANLCMACHSGRSSGEAIKTAENIKTHFGAFNSHYLAAGGIIFRTLPYEFDGRSYSDFNPHANIKELCVACHMPNGDHTLEPLVKEGGVVKGIKAFKTTCIRCHVSEEKRISILKEREEQYKASLEYIASLLAKRGIYYDEKAYPYFYPSPNPADGRGPEKAYKDWPDRDTLGSAYNLNLLSHEPGAYVHNPEYVKEIIYDTIDFLDNGKLDNSALENAPDAVKSYLEGVR